MFYNCANLAEVSSSFNAPQATCEFGLYFLTHKTESAASKPAPIFRYVNISSSVVQMGSNFYGIGHTTFFEILSLIIVFYSF